MFGIVSAAHRIPLAATMLMLLALLTGAVACSKTNDPTVAPRERSDYFPEY